MNRNFPNLVFLFTLFYQISLIYPANTANTERGEENLNNFKNFKNFQCEMVPLEGSPLVTIQWWFKFPIELPLFLTHHLGKTLFQVKIPEIGKLSMKEWVESLGGECRFFLSPGFFSLHLSLDRKYWKTLKKFLQLLPPILFESTLKLPTVPHSDYDLNSQLEKDLDTFYQSFKIQKENRKATLTPPSRGVLVFLGDPEFLKQEEVTPLLEQCESFSKFPVFFTLNPRPEEEPFPSSFTVIPQPPASPYQWNLFFKIPLSNPRGFLAWKIFQENLVKELHPIKFRFFQGLDHQNLITGIFFQGEPDRLWGDKLKLEKLFTSSNEETFLQKGRMVVEKALFDPGLDQENLAFKKGFIALLGFNGTDLLDILIKMTSAEFKGEIEKIYQKRGEKFSLSEEELKNPFILDLTTPTELKEFSPRIILKTHSWWPKISLLTRLEFSHFPKDPSGVLQKIVVGYIQETIKSLPQLSIREGRGSLYMGFQSDNWGSFSELFKLWADLLRNLLDQPSQLSFLKELRLALMNSTPNNLHLENQWVQKDLFSHLISNLIPRIKFSFSGPIYSHQIRWLFQENSFLKSPGQKPSPETIPPLEKWEGRIQGAEELFFYYLGKVDFSQKIQQIEIMENGHPALPKPGEVNVPSSLEEFKIRHQKLKGYYSILESSIEDYGHFLLHLLNTSKGNGPIFIEKILNQLDPEKGIQFWKNSK